MWGSPQVLFPRLQQQVRADGENLYDSDSEGEITRSSPLRFPKSAKSAFGSSISFLKSASQKCFFADAKIASDRWAHPPERVPERTTFQGEVLQRTFEREAEGERFDTPDEQRRLQKLAARACEVR